MSMALSICRIRGIRVAIHASWLLLFALVTWSVTVELAPFGRIPAALAGVLYALALFASIVVHEVAHALCARTYGVQTRVITLFAFGGIATLDDEPPTPAAEIAIALAGPLASFVLGGLAFAVSWVLWSLDPGAATPVATAAELLALANLLLGAFNLVPAFPMDGGRVLRAVLWRVSGNRSAATRVAALCGVGFGAALGVAGIVMVATTRDWHFVWYAVLGGFIVRMTWQTHAEARRRSQIERTGASVALRAEAALP
jgi:Zn-dependent protease